MRQIIFATLLMLVLVGTNVACNTVHGFGQDVERAGEKDSGRGGRREEEIVVPLLKWPEISAEEPPSQESWPHDISFLIGLLLDSNL